jgi:hypothetical protein
MRREARGASNKFWTLHSLTPQASRLMPAFK